MGVDKILGPIIGHTTARTTKIWLRGNMGQPEDNKHYYGVVEVRNRDKQLVQSRYCRLLAGHDYTGCVTIDGLTPDTKYTVSLDLRSSEVEFDINSVLSQSTIQNENRATSEFRTARAADSLKLRLVFGSCRYNFWPGNATKGDKTFRSILSLHQENPLDLLIMVGDQIYADPLNVVGQSNEIEEFWEKYRDYFGQQHLSSLMSRVPTYMILDDHEIRNDWSKEQAGKYDGLYQAAMSAYHSYQHIHNPDTTEGKFWYSFKVGAFPFFALDCRTQRIKGSDNIKQKTLLGVRQYNVLIDWLYQNKEAPKLFIICSVPFFPDNRADKDKWSEFDDERGRLLEFIRTEKITGVTFLSGDVHNTNFSRMSCFQDPDFEIISLVSSPFYWPYFHDDESDFYINRMLEYYQWKTSDRREMDYIQYSYQAEGFIDQENFVEVTIDLETSPSICQASVFDRKGAIVKKYSTPFIF